MSLAKTGLSGSLRMGGVAELAIDDSIALRVRFDGRAAAVRPAVLARAGAVALRRPRMVSQ